MTGGGVAWAVRSDDDDGAQLYAERNPVSESTMRNGAELHTEALTLRVRRS